MHKKTLTAFAMAGVLAGLAMSAMLGQPSDENKIGEDKTAAKKLVGKHKKTTHQQVMDKKEKSR